MPSTEENNRVLQDILSKCYTSAHPLNTLAEEIGKLSVNGGWSAAQTQQLTQRALRMLSIMMELPEQDQLAGPLKLHDEPDQDQRRA